MEELRRTNGTGLDTCSEEMITASRDKQYHRATDDEDD